MARDRSLSDGPAGGPVADRPAAGKKGRPRLTVEEFQARLDAYCAKYGVTATAEGIPPFPAGRRETRQHREWIAVYKAHARLERRRRGQCERCEAPASPGSLFCDAHRAAAASRSAPSSDARASVDERRGLLQDQKGRCPVCMHELPVSSAVEHEVKGRPRALLHQPCHQLVTLVEQAGPEALSGLRGYLWPRARKRRGR